MIPSQPNQKLILAEILAAAAAAAAMKTLKCEEHQTCFSGGGGLPRSF